MKQKVLAVLVMTAMLGTSVVPVTAAEFNSGEETAAVQENDTAGLEEEFSSGVNAGYDYDDDDDYKDRKKSKKRGRYADDDETSEDGRRRYTVAQIAGEFGVSLPLSS